MKVGSVNFAHLATKLVAMATSLGWSQSEGTLNEALQCIYQSRKFGEGPSSRFWDFGAKSCTVKKKENKCRINRSTTYSPFGGQAERVKNHSRYYCTILTTCCYKTSKIISQLFKVVSDVRNGDFLLVFHTIHFSHACTGVLRCSFQNVVVNQPETSTAKQL